MPMWDQYLPKFYDYLLYEKDHSKYKVNSYRKIFRQLSQKLPIPFFLPQIREFLVDKKRSGLSPAYINFWITAINCFIRWCAIEGVPQEDITATLNELRPRLDRTPDANDVLSIQEVIFILSNPTNRPIQNENLREYFTKVDDMYSLLFSLIYKMGARSGEVLQLKKKHINFSNHSMTFYETKTGGDRTVAIPPDEEERLREYIKNLNDTDHLFTGNHHGCDGQTLSQEMANKAFKYRAKLWNIDRSVHIHMLRHSAITHMLLNGAPLPVVQAMIGHKRLATTELYTHILVENQRDCMLKYNPLIRRTKDVKLIFQRMRDTVTDLHLDEDDRLVYRLEEGRNSIRIEIYEK